jgi:hypothetical protein
MARATQPVILPKGPYPVLPVGALALDFVFTVADNVNFDEFAFTGRELILVSNPTGGALTFTLESVADGAQRTGDVTTYSVGAGLFSCFWAGNVVGWNNSGKFFLKGSAATLKFAVIRIPG